VQFPLAVFQSTVLIYTIENKPAWWNTKDANYITIHDILHNTAHAQPQLVYKNKHDIPP